MSCAAGARMSGETGASVGVRGTAHEPGAAGAAGASAAGANVPDAAGAGVDIPGAASMACAAKSMKG